MPSARAATLLSRPQLSGFRHDMSGLSNFLERRERFCDPYAARLRLGDFLSPLRNGLRLDFRTEELGLLWL